MSKSVPPPTQTAWCQTHFCKIQTLPPHSRSRKRHTYNTRRLFPTTYRSATQTQGAGQLSSRPPTRWPMICPRDHRRKTVLAQRVSHTIELHLASAAWSSSLGLVPELPRLRPIDANQVAFVL